MNSDDMQGVPFCPRCGANPDTTERKPGMGIDSLLANAIEKLRGQLCGEGELASELEEARAAVAELLHDARIAARTLEESDDAMDRTKGRSLSASIARVGSAA